MVIMKKHFLVPIAAGALAIAIAAAEALANGPARNAQGKCVQNLRYNLRDPDSLVVESVRGSEIGAITVIFRARNGFGGMNRDSYTCSSY